MARLDTFSIQARVNVFYLPARVQLAVGFNISWLLALMSRFPIIMIIYYYYYYYKELLLLLLSLLFIIIIIIIIIIILVIVIIIIIVFIIIIIIIDQAYMQFSPTSFSIRPRSM